MEFPFSTFLHGSRGMSSKCDEIWVDNNYQLPIITEETDWDYAVQDRDFVKIWLERNKFVINDVSSYADNDTKWVYEKFIDGKKVQVSLRENIKRYRDCFTGVSLNFYLKFLHKSSPTCLPKDAQREYWNSLYYSWDMGKQSKNVDEDISYALTI